MLQLRSDATSGHADTTGGKSPEHLSVRSGPKFHFELWRNQAAIRSLSSNHSGLEALL
jgi:hypothetical protein